MTDAILRARVHRMRILQGNYQSESRDAKTPLRPIRKPGRYRNPVVGWTGGDLCVSVCGFDFVFQDRGEAAVYLHWFEHYEKQHRRQFDIIDARPSLRNRLVKLPAHLFKTQNRPKVIKALKAVVEGGE